MQGFNWRQHWWKLLGVLLMLYTLIAGFLIPLKPGILDFSNNKALTGETYQVEVETYNTYIKQYDTRVWLLLPDDKLLKAQTVEVEDDNHLKAFIHIPYNLALESDRGMDATLVIDNEKDGFFLYPDAVRIKKGSNQNLKASFYELDELKNSEAFKFPFRHILHETIRNTFFHVALWMAMFLILLFSCYHSVQYLRTKELDHDSRSSAMTTVALVFGIAGLLTGSMWARYTWGAFWTNDVKLNMTAIALLIYFAYWILRASLTDVDSRARLSSVFNLFAFVSLMILVMVIPRLSEDSLHPGNGGNPAFGSDDLDNTLRTVFYPAIIAYTLIGFWMAQLLYRFELVQNKWMDRED